MLSKYLNGHILTTEDCRFNQRKKLYINQQGELLAVEVMTSTSKCFSDGGNELSEMSVKRKRHQDNQKLIEQMHYELYNEPVQPVVKENPIERSKRRAKKQIKDLILCGNFDTFVTLTLDSEKIDRQDYGAVIKKVNAYLNNRVKRDGLRYLGVAERHKKGGIHFHFLVNGSALKLADSGTVSVQGKKRPIKIATADRQNIPLEQRHTVYNVTDWSLGFSTAIACYGDVMSVSAYVCKYITKADEKIGGRWYYSGGKLCKPVVQYGNADYTTAPQDWEYDTGYNKLKCRLEQTKCDL